MRIAIIINTPAQLHFYRTIVNELQAHGHTTGIMLRDYMETRALADKMGLDYVKYSGHGKKSKVGTLLNTPKSWLSAVLFKKDFKPDFVIGSGIIEFPFSFLGVPGFVFIDNEPRTDFSLYIQQKLYLPFTDAIITPESYRTDLGPKHIRMPSFKELSYLHPNHFRPRSDILDLMDIDFKTPFVILRFNAFDSIHDVGMKRITNEQKREMIARLEPFANVFISSESPLPDDLRKYELHTPKDRIHDVLYYATMLITETGTMTTEAALLGTPAIMIHPKVDLFGNFVELKDKYGLIFTYKGAGPAMDKASELIQRPRLKKEWSEKLDTLLKDKVDAAKFIIDMIEGYPGSVEKYVKEKRLDTRRVQMLS